MDNHGLRVALACQGGGSHAAFAAGALKRALAEDGVDIEGFSGTSGGAVCALLAWYGLRTGGREEAARLLQAFWEENSARTLAESWANAWTVGARRLGGYAPEPPSSPYRFPEVAKAELARLLVRHVDFGRVREISSEPGPRLMVGAVNVGSGEHRTFDSARGEISLESVLASCAVPSLIRAVEVDGEPYWDGLFSQNPPLRDLPWLGIDEIWLVQLDPKGSVGEPRTHAEISDRRDQLFANLSLEQELSSLRAVGKVLAKEGLVGGEGYPPLTVRRLVMGLNLDAASKLDRSPAFVRRLVAEGERQAALAAMNPEAVTVPGFPGPATVAA